MLLVPTEDKQNKITQMRNIILILIIWLISVNGYSQISGLIYNHHGHAIADTSLTITSTQLQLWNMIEDSLVKHLRNSELYSDTAIRYGLQGTLKSYFDIDSTGTIVDYKPILFVNKSVNRKIITALNSFNEINVLAPKKKTYRYYLIFIFILTKNSESYFEEGKIVILHPSPVRHY